jgi:hypothetical protein
MSSMEQMGLTGTESNLGSKKMRHKQREAHDVLNNLN